MTALRLLLLVLLVYAAAVAQTTLVDVLRIGETVPELLPLVALVWVLTVDSPYAFVAAGAIGLVDDLLGPGRAGLGGFWLLAAGYLLGRMKARLPRGHWAWQVPALGLAVAGWAAGAGLCGWLAGDVALPPRTLLRHAVGVGVYTAALSLPVFLVVGWIKEPRRRTPV